MAKFFVKNHFIWLTIALIGMMLSGAVKDELPSRLSPHIFEYSSLLLLIFSLVSLRNNRVWGQRLLLIIGCIVVVVIFRGITDAPYFEYFYLFLLLLFFVTAAWLVGHQVLLTGNVDINIIFGSLSLYLLLGLIWSIFYTVLLEFSPESFHGIDAGPWFDNMRHTTYFSFVTLTTLGYGDISPARPLAQMLVVFEAITGMFYLAVVVASLIGTLKRKNV